VLKHCAANRKRRLSALPNVGQYTGCPKKIVSFFYFLPVSWKEWLAFPLETCLVISKELKSRASYILRVPDIEIPTIPQKEM
jgi:hypothetical protein